MKRFKGLKGCPCCGGQPIVLIQQIGRERVVRIECTVCKISTANICFARDKGPYDSRRRMLDLGLNLDLAASREQAAATWNRRPRDAEE